MDAPLQGDTGGHTGAAPTTPHQTPLSRNLPRFSPSAEPLPLTLGHGATREMVGAAPVCPPERPRSGVSIRKGHVPIRKGGVSIRKGHVPQPQRSRFHLQKTHPHPQKRRFHALKCLCIAHNAHLLTMDAPLQGDAGGHTGTAPTNLHQTPLPCNLPRFCPSAEPLPATFSCFSPSAEPLPATFSCFSPSAESLPATFSCFSPSAEPLPATFSCFSPSAEPLLATFSRFSPSAEPLPATFAHETRKVAPFMKGLQLFFVILQPIVSITRKR